ncbi:hypothetical protein [Azonexus hydrophilus]|uniref:PABS domain-containing protein n=1 Tax=Azonexus hydrophilus TaxID=418702 RepID=A0ABZ2XL76_9RHOO
MLLEKVSLPQAAIGPWRIESFTTNQHDIHSLLRGRGVPIGQTYTRLMRGNTVVMSDTPAEMRDHLPAYFAAQGSCLINGLGLGMLLKSILKKPEVTDITVIELSKEVIDLVAPHYTDPRIQIIHASAFDYQPPKGKQYGMVWHDIWDYICEDNLPEMHTLHRKYGRRATWQGSWCRAQCEQQRDRWPSRLR